MIGNNMKKFVFVLVCVVFFNCGGGGGDSGLKVTAGTDLSGNSSSLKNRKDYPGFTEASEKPSDFFDFYDGFFDKHPEAIKTIEHTFDTEQTDELGNSSIEEISTSTYVNYEGTASQVFALRDRYNVVNVHIAWDPNESYANHEDLKFFLCSIDDKDNYKPIEGLEYNPINGLNCSAETKMCAVDQDEWSKGAKNITLQVNVGQHNKNVKVGLCMQYATYSAVLYDALEVKVYPMQSFDVTFAFVGESDDNIRKNVEDRIKETLGRAGVEIKFTSEVTYRIPDDFENYAYRERDLDKGYLYVAVAPKNEETSNCYSDIGDDLFWIKDKIESDVGRRNEIRTAVVLNRPTVKFWTINDNYQACTNNLEVSPDKKENNGYVVGILNNEHYSDCQQKYPYAGEVYYHYSLSDGKWVWESIYGMNVDNEIDTYINPKCHVLLNMDRFKRAYTGSSDYYYRTLMPSGALGVTKKANQVGGLPGLIAFNPPNDEVVFVHELTHLCGLSDVDNPQDNLMYFSKKNGSKLGNIPLKVTNSSGLERQWDCLHDGISADGCDDKSYRLISF